MTDTIAFRPELEGIPHPNTKIFRVVQEWALANGQCTARVSRGFGYFAEVCGTPVKRRHVDLMCPRHTGVEKAKATREANRRARYAQQREDAAQQRTRFGERHAALAKYGFDVYRYSSGTDDVTFTAADVDRLIDLLRREVSP